MKRINRAPAHPLAATSDRIVIAEVGPLRGRSDLLTGKNQRLFVQMPGETLARFSDRAAPRIRQARATSARFVLGKDPRLSCRLPLFESLRLALSETVSPSVELIAPLDVRGQMLWCDLLDELASVPEFNGIRYRLRWDQPPELESGMDWTPPQDAPASPKAKAS